MDGGGRKKSADDVTLGDRRRMPVHCGNRGKCIVSCTVDTTRAPAHSRHIPAQAGLCSRVRSACSVCVVTSLVLGVLRQFIVPLPDTNVFNALPVVGIDVIIFERHVRKRGENRMTVGLRPGTTAQSKFEFYPQIVCVSWLQEEYEENFKFTSAYYLFIYIIIVIIVHLWPFGNNRYFFPSTSVSLRLNVFVRNNDFFRT